MAAKPEAERKISMEDSLPPVSKNNQCKINKFIKNK